MGFLSCVLYSIPFPHSHWMGNTALHHGCPGEEGERGASSSRIGRSRRILDSWLGNRCWLSLERSRRQCWDVSMLRRSHRGESGGRWGVVVVNSIALGCSHPPPRKPNSDVEGAKGSCILVLLAPRTCHPSRSRLARRRPRLAELAYLVLYGWRERERFAVGVRNRGPRGPGKEERGG